MRVRFPPPAPERKLQARGVRLASLGELNCLKSDFKHWSKLFTSAICDRAKTAKEPGKTIGSNHILILGEENFFIMNKELIKQFFKPDLMKIVLFMIFMFIAFAGYTQSWVFSGKDMGSPKPPLFDLLAPFPFWVVWVFLLLPLALLSNLIVTVGDYDMDFIMRGPFWPFGIINVIYFYMLSCLIIFVVDKFRRKR